MRNLSSLFTTLQLHIIPFQEEGLGELSPKHKSLVALAELAGIDAFMRPFDPKRNGRPPHARQAIAMAFLAKAVWNLKHTRELIDRLKCDRVLRRLCGWETALDVPGESTFSRAFAAFADARLPEAVHAAMIKKQLGEKLVGHVSRDSTPIDGRERAAKKPPPAPKKKARRGRPRKGETRPPREPRRLEKQLTRALAENVADLPTACDCGMKLDSKGHKKAWVGYKLHVDAVDGDIPVGALLTSASTHDSQAAIPLAQMSARRFVSLYDLMDSAYDAPEIKAFSTGLGHVPIIEHNPRRGEKKEMAPHRAIRYRERSAAERIMSNLKDNYGGRFVRVRGAKKVMCHLMFGVVAMAGAQLFRLVE